MCDNIRGRMTKLIDQASGVAWSIHLLAHTQTAEDEPALCPHTIKALAEHITETNANLTSIIHDLPDPDQTQRSYDLGFGDACRTIRNAMRGPRTSTVSDRAMGELRVTLDAIAAASSPQEMGEANPTAFETGTAA